MTALHIKESELKNKPQFQPIHGKFNPNKKDNRINLYIDFLKQASTNLPYDVVVAMQTQRDKEKPGSQAKKALDIILKNIEMAEENSTPICQDTGTNIYHIHFPVGVSTIKIKEDIQEATIEATKIGYLRPNAVDSITGKNSGNNIGTGLPTFFFDEWNNPNIEIKLMLKGGGCENVGAQYSLPNINLDAGRDIKGVKKVIIDAVVQAQGKGCAPGILGVGIGGDRVTSALLAKEQLFRNLQDENPDPILRDMEEELLEKCNTLGIGPMGFGGMTTLIGIKIGKMHRIPASYFVSISYMCWATRRKTLTILKNDYSIK